MLYDLRYSNLIESDITTWCQKLYQYCKSGWPHRQSIAGAVQPYISVASETTVHGELLLKDNIIIIPSVLRLDIPDKLHIGHQGINKCRERARQAVSS